MPSDFDKEAYPEPPQKTPIINKQTVIPNPVEIGSNVFYYVVDLPVTKFREIIDGIRSRNKLVYYHRKYRRVPYLTDCVEGDLPCNYEADMQFRRDYKVDREIVKIVQERMGACIQREGESHVENCAKEVQLFEEVSKNYEVAYGDMGWNPTAKKCLMKQKERMMAAQAQSAQD